MSFHTVPATAPTCGADVFRNRAGVVWLLLTFTRTMPSNAGDGDHPAGNTSPTSVLPLGRLSNVAWPLPSVTSDVSPVSNEPFLFAST